MAVLKNQINNHLRYKHPYETEIREARYPPFARVISDPISYLPYESTKATWVDTPEAVVEMMRELKQAKEIAVDLEHHDKHSYIGLVSLMQISTRNHDWVVDTLRPWREDLQLLNEVFANPEIIKVSFKPLQKNLQIKVSTGLPRRLHGHDMAPKGPWLIRRWLVRHVPCICGFGISKT